MPPAVLLSRAVLGRPLRNPISEVEHIKVHGNRRT